MLLEPLVAFARAALEPGAVGDPDDPAAGGDQAFLLQRLDHRVDRRPLDPEQSRERFLGELDPVAGAVLRVEQPARGALRDRMEGIARRPTASPATADNRRSGRTNWR